MESCLDAGKQWAYGGCHKLSEWEFTSYGNPNQTWVGAHAGSITTGFIAGTAVVAFFAVGDYLNARRTRIAT